MQTENETPVFASPSTWHTVAIKVNVVKYNSRCLSIWKLEDGEE